MTMTLEELASHVEAKLQGAVERRDITRGELTLVVARRARSCACSRNCATIRSACSRC